MEPLNYRPQYSPLSIARALWKHKVLMTFIWIVAGAVATAVVFCLPAVYRAEIVILVESQRIPERFVASTVSADLNDRLSNLKQQILSYTRLLNIINKYDLYRSERKRKSEEEVIELMRKDTNVVLERGWSKEQPGAFRISYEGEEPAVVAQVANELGELFIDQNLRSREVNALGTSEFLQDQLGEAKRRLEEQEAKLGDYKRTHNGELPQQESGLTASLNRLQSQLQNVQDELSRAQQNKALKDSDVETARTSQTALVNLSERGVDPGQPSGSAVTVEKESTLLEAQLAALQARYSDTHPDVRAARAALAKAKEREAQEAAAVPAVAASRPAAKGSEVTNGTLIRERERVEQSKALQANAAKQVDDLEAERRRVLREIAGMQARLLQLPVREQQMAGLVRDYENSKANYQSLLDKKLAAEMATQMEKNQKSERFTVLDSARVPTKPIKPDRVLFGVGGWVLGLLVALTGGLVFEFHKNVVLGEWELPAGTVVLGRVPRIVVVAAASGPGPSGNGNGRLLSSQVS